MIRLENVSRTYATGGGVTVLRNVTLHVERGEAEAGIVYATDAKSAPDVKLVAALDGSLKSDTS